MQCHAGDLAVPSGVTWALQNLFIWDSLVLRAKVRFQVGNFSSSLGSGYCERTVAQAGGQSLHQAPPALAATAEPVLMPL